jgi:hypothetical protein
MRLEVVLYDPTYWPENGFYKYPEKVRGFSKQYDYLVVHREGGIHQITYQKVQERLVSLLSRLMMKLVQLLHNRFKSSRITLYFSQKMGFTCLLLPMFGMNGM